MAEQLTAAKKTEKIAKLREQIDQLEIEKQELKEQIAAHKKELNKDKKMRDAAGTVFRCGCVLAVIVLVLSAADYFHWAEVVVVGAVLGLWIFFKIMEKVCFNRLINKYGCWHDAKQAGKDLEKQLGKKEGEQARKEREIDLLEGKPDALNVYRGFDWNMKNFKATAANIKAMELDLENLFVAMKYIAGSNKQIDNWMGRSRKLRYKAIQNGNYEIKEKYDAGYMRMAQAGSWKLQVGRVAALVLDEALLIPSFDCTDIPYFRKLCERENVRGPETPEEKEFVESAAIASLLMGMAFQYLQKNEMLFD